LIRQRQVKRTMVNVRAIWHITRLPAGDMLRSSKPPFNRMRSCWRWSSHGVAQQCRCERAGELRFARPPRRPPTCAHAFCPQQHVATSRPRGVRVRCVMAAKRGVAVCHGSACTNMSRTAVHQVARVLAQENGAECATVCRRHNSPPVVHASEWRQRGGWRFKEVLRFCC